MTPQTLHQTLGQQLQLTPKLQQAIRMLQLSTQELTQELMNALEANVMLELEEQLNEVATPVSQLNEEALNQPPDHQDPDFNEVEIAPYESSFETCSKSASDFDTTYPNWQQQNQEDLQTYLLWQLRASQFSESDYLIGEAIIYAINNEGFLTEPLPDHH